MIRLPAFSFFIMLKLNIQCPEVRLQARILDGDDIGGFI